MHFHIPPADLAEYSQLPEDVRTDIRRSLGCLSRMQAAGGVMQASAATLKLRGFSESSLKRKWYAFKDGGWRALIDKASLPKGATLPLEFQDYWRELVGTNNRKLTRKTAYGRFMKLFRAGESIDGLGTWQDWHRRHERREPPRDGCPWDVLTPPPLLSYRSVMRISLNSAELAAQRSGVGAARKHMATLRTDLSGLRLLEAVVFDDFRTDFKAIHFATGEVCEIWGLAAMDMATRKILGFVLRPRLRRADDTTTGLARRDMLHLCGRILKEYGYPKDYQSIWIMENASATVRDETAEVLALISAGQIDVRKTQMFKAKALLGGWSDTAGNPNGKGALESFWNYSWNHLGWELGQTGASYELKPMTIDARQAEAIRLLKAGSALPLAIREQLTQGYFHSVEDASRIIHEVWQALADRIDHKMEGFAVISEWRWVGSAAWANQAIVPLPPLPKEALELAVQFRPRLETCNERARRLLARDGANFERPTDNALALIFCDSKTLTYNGSGVFLIEAKNRSSRMFKADHLGLTQGQKYTLIHDGENFSEMYVLSARGEFLGTINYVKRVAYLDQEAVSEAIAEKEGRIKEMLRRVRGRQSTDDLAARMTTLDAQEGILRQLPGLRTAPTERQETGISTALNARDSARELSKADKKAAVRLILSNEARRGADLSALDALDDEI